MVANVMGIGGLAILVVFLLGIGLYFLPTIVAFGRHHHQAGAVFAINLLLGWTLIGWAVALAMALSAHREQPVVISQYNPGPAPPLLGPTPGWYSDPGDSSGKRYWSGTEWGPAYQDEPGPASP